MEGWTASGSIRVTAASCQDSGMAKRPSGGTPATESLAKAGVPFEIHPYDMGDLPESDTYGEAVAALLGVEPERLFKTLLAVVDDEPAVAVVPVSTRLSTKLLAKASGGKKAALMDPTDAERLTGYVTGGISPFGQKRRLPMFVDETCRLFETIFVSAGRRGLQVEVRPDDLIRLLDASVVELI